MGCDYCGGDHDVQVNANAAAAVVEKEWPDWARMARIKAAALPELHRQMDEQGLPSEGRACGYLPWQQNWREVVSEQVIGLVDAELAKRGGGVVVLFLMGFHQ